LAEVCAADRQVTLARELTKRFEAVTTLSVANAPDWLAADPQRGQGECVLIVHEAKADASNACMTDDAAAPATASVQIDTLLDVLLETLSVRDATRIAARATGLARDLVYAKAVGRSAKSR